MIACMFDIGCFRICMYTEMYQRVVNRFEFIFIVLTNHINYLLFPLCNALSDGDKIVYLLPPLVFTV